MGRFIVPLGFLLAIAISVTLWWNLPVLGEVVDYSWNHGTVVLDLAAYRQLSQKADRDQVSSFEVYLRQQWGHPCLQLTFCNALRHRHYQHIFRYGEMRKEAGFLNHVTDAAP